ncbi:MAG TPA: ATP-binding protein [Anaerolineaceae bacterium]|nr:ATP-binding protein [Anaerolineaceae bacterium]
MKAQAGENPILVVTDNEQINQLLEQVLKSAGYPVSVRQTADAASERIAQSVPALVILSASLPGNQGLKAAAEWSQHYPALPIILFFNYETVDQMKQAMRAGVRDVISLPVKTDEILRAVAECLQQSQALREYVRMETRSMTGRLQQRISELETLSRLGQSITNSLEVDLILRAVVDAAVEMTGAEEGSLLLLDEENGELYMRAARNFNDEFVRTFRLPIQDTLAGSVLNSGQPVSLDQNTPKKIKTSYLVHSLLYVPLKLQDRVIGVLGVDNRYSPAAFKPQDTALLGAMADYAVIAIENARLFESSNAERLKAEAIITRIQDGVIVLDHDRRLVLMNRSAQQAFQIDPALVLPGRLAEEIFSSPDLLDLMKVMPKNHPIRSEVTAVDGRVFSAQLSPVPEVGVVITLHDITNLKKIDRIKSDFVSTVSHDLRSPLTAILGYVELIERAGPTTDLQRDFIRRVQVSVQNITNLVNDLVNLGRIEAGFDTRLESVQLGQLVRFSADSYRRIFEQKQVEFDCDIPIDLPPVYGNPGQLRQMIEHLLDNANKYTDPGGCITLRAEREQEQLILQVVDSGAGIPPIDLPFIFDKFYRGSNISTDTSGTGLGLAIVKSIVENHQGRIWVDSLPGKGSTFTVVLPLSG